MRPCADGFTERERRLQQLLEQSMAMNERLHAELLSLRRGMTTDSRAVRDEQQRVRSGGSASAATGTNVSHTKAAHTPFIVHVRPCVRHHVDAMHSAGNTCARPRERARRSPSSPREVRCTRSTRDDNEYGAARRIGTAMVAVEQRSRPAPPRRARTADPRPTRARPPETCAGRGVTPRRTPAQRATQPRTPRAQAGAMTPVTTAGGHAVSLCTTSNDEVEAQLGDYLAQSRRVLQKLEQLLLAT